MAYFRRFQFYCNNHVLKYEQVLFIRVKYNGITTMVNF